MKTLAIKALAAVSLSLLVVAPVAAQEVQEIQVTVHYGDLDIASPDGARVLAARVQNAAERACVRPSIRDLKAGAAWDACKDAAIAAAVEQLAQQGGSFEGTSLAGL